MARTRIYVDSVLDKEHVRVLISTDGKTEKPLILDKDAFEVLVKDEKEFWKDVTRGRRTIRKLRRDIEGEVITFPDSETPFFKDLEETFKRPPRLMDEGRVRKVRKENLQRQFKKPTRATGKLQKKLRDRRERIRKRTGEI